MDARPLLLTVLLSLAAGCEEPGSACADDLGELGRAAAWDDPVTVLDRYDGPSFSELADLEVAGDTLWFCTSVIGLQAYDISDPARLRKLDDLAPSGGNQTYPRCQHLSVAEDGRVYATNRSNSISRQSFVAVVDGRDPENLVELGALNTPDNVEGSAVVGDLLFVAAHEDGLIAYRRGEGAQLTELGRLQDGLSNAWTVRVRDGLAYVADGGGGISVVDVSDPAAMSHITSLELGGAVKDLELDGDRLWVAAGAAGLAVVDLAEPRAPALIELENTPGSALGVASGGDAVYVADWNDVRVFDVSDRSDARLVGQEPLHVASGDSSRTLGIAAKGETVFSGNWTELVAYRHHPGVSAPDLTVSPQRIALPDPDELGEARASAVLRNVGARALTISDLAADRSSLSFENLEPGTLEPGEERTVTVLNESSSTAALDGWLAILSDDPDEPRKCLPVQGNNSGRTVGDSAPAASFVDLEGGEHRLEDLEGSPVFLAYFATF